MNSLLVKSQKRREKPPKRDGDHNRKKQKRKALLTHPKRLKIHIDILPRAPWRRINLMHDSQMRMLLDDAVPPVPGLPVLRAIGKRLQRIDVFPIG